MSDITKNTAAQAQGTAAAPAAAAPASKDAAPKAVAAAPAATATAAKPAAAKPAAPQAPAAPALNQLAPQRVAPEALRATLERLYAEQGMDFLVCLTGVDREADGLGVVYNLENTATGQRACVESFTTDREQPLLPSVSDLWEIANVYEREAFDFYGIRFINHPDMRRIFMREDWVGYPFRKDDATEENNPLRMTNEPLADETETLTLAADGTLTTTRNTIFEKGDYVVNIGPQHPSTHGVLHFRVSLEGERIRKIDPILGYIHRGVEKLNEQLTYPQTLALTDRLDYLGAMQNRHAVCMCVEQAMGVEVSDRVKVVRTIMDELQRIDSHILYFSCLCQDLGATTAFLYGFRDREKLLDIFEETCGGRLILNYNAIGGLMADIHPNFQRRVKEFIPYMRRNIKEYHDIFTGNVIFQNRAKGVGILSREQCISLGCTGGTGRAAGWHNDVRKRHPYAAYDRVDFREVTYTQGDSFARYMVRMDEILESLSIIEQLIDNIPEGNFREKMKPIIKVPEGQYYTSVEGSRGEFGVYLESRGDKSPYRMHYRATGLPLVAAMDTACSGAMLADLITIGGTVDYVVPDIDR